MIEAWIERFGIGNDHKQTVADIVEAAPLMVLDGSTGFNNEPENPQLHSACVTSCDRRGRIDVDSLGLWLRGKKGRISDGRKIMNDTQTKKGKRTATLWWIELVTVTTEGDLKKESAKPKTKF